MSKSTLTITPYLRSNYVGKNGKCSIMIRIILNGERIQFSSKLEIETDKWDAAQGKAAGRTAAATELNNALDNIRASLLRIYRELEQRESYVTAEKIRNIFLGYEVREKTLLRLFKSHNEDVEKLVGKGKSKATIQKYNRTYNHVEDFLRLKYKVSDIAFVDINHSFITNFEVYLKTVCNCNDNTTAKFIQFFKRIILIARKNGWIYADPFQDYKISIRQVDRGFLTEQDLEKIIKKEFATKRLEQVRDIFLFSCFTGLAYIDVKNLTETNIQHSFDGNLWINTHRQKTDTTVNVPLLKIPLEIIEKYKGLPEGRILPVLSNQKMNSYLKEIGDLCGIKKNLTFHLARHTFATTVTLSKGVSIETVSKMLGHTNIETTQIYARITNEKIKNEMATLTGKLTSIENTYSSVVQRKTV